MIWLGVCLALGLWISTEFLVPWALVAATFAALYGVSGQLQTLERAMTTWGVATACSLLAVALERGPDWRTITFDRISLIHVSIGAGALAVFAGARSYVAASTSRRRRFAVLGVGGIGVGTLLVSLTPKLLGGPFVDVNPRLKGLWLDHVTELQSLFNGPSSKLVVTIVGPFLLHIVSAVLLLRRGEDMDRYALITLSWWLVAYVLLSLYEVRWAIFGHLLAVVLLVAVLDRLYRQPWHGALGLIAPPMTVAVLLLVMAGSGLIAPSPGSGSLSPSAP